MVGIVKVQHGRVIFLILASLGGQTRFTSSAGIMHMTCMKLSGRGKFISKLEKILYFRLRRFNVTEI